MAGRSAPFRPNAPIVAELAAGALLLSPSGNETFLLHHREDRRWCFPKGHVDPGESLRETAVREIREETGFSRVRLGAEVDEVSYRFYRPSERRNIHKTVVYFVAFTPEREPHPEPIFDRTEWVTLPIARSLVKFGTDRHVLDAVVRQGRTSRASAR